MGAATPHRLARIGLVLILCGVLITSPVAAATTTATTTAEITEENTTEHASGFDLKSIWQTVSSIPALTSTTANTQTGPVSITLTEPNRAGHSSDGVTSQVPEVAPNQSLTYANGSNYRFVITDEDNGGTITTTPPITNTTSEPVILNNPDPDGTIDGYGAFRIPGVTNGTLDAPVTTSGDVATRGVVNLSVALTDANSGSIIAETKTQPYVLGYVDNFTQSGTNGTFEIGVNRSVLPRNTSLKATIYNATADYPGETSDQVVISLSYDAATDDFTGFVPSDELAGGTYSIDVEGTLPEPYNTPFEDHGESVFTVDGNGSSSDGDSNTGIVNGTLTSQSGASLAGDTVTFWNVTNYTYRYTEVEASGFFEATDIPKNLAYNVGFNDIGENASSNGVPDFYAIERVTSVPASLDERTLPEAYNKSIRVVNQSGAPIKNASLSVQHKNGDAVTREYIENATDGNGYFNVSGWTSPELIGNITISVYVNSDSRIPQTTNTWNVDGSGGELNLTVKTADLTGQVKLPDESNATSDTISLNEVNGTSWYTAVTDDSGRFTASVSPNASYNVLYAQTDAANNTRTFPLDGVPDIHPITRVNVDGETDLGVQQLPEANRLNVTVTDDSDAPIPNATVYLEVRANDAKAYAQGTTNADGQLVLGDTVGLEANGTVKVTITRPPGTTYANKSEPVSLTEGDKNESITLSEPVSVTGNITDANGTAVDSGTIIYNGGYNDYAEPIVDNGTYQTTILEGTYNVGFAQSVTRHDTTTGFPLDDVPDIYSGTQVTVAGPTTNNISLPEGHHIQIQVVNQSGHGVPNVPVEVSHQGDGSDVDVDTHTNGTGYVTLGGTPGLEVNGTVSIDLEADSYVANIAPIEVTEDRTYTVNAREAVDVIGNVSYADGTAAVGQLVNAISTKETDIGNGNTTTEGGNFEVPVSKNGTYDLAFRQLPREDGPSIDDGNPDIYTLDEVTVEDTSKTLGGYTLPRGHDVNITVRGPNDELLPHTDVDVEYTPRNGNESLFDLSTNSVGRVTLEQVTESSLEIANGTLNVSVEPESVGVLSREVSYNITGPLTETIRLNASVLVNGTVVDANQTPVTGENVFVDPENAPDEDTWTDDTGSFRAGVTKNATVYVGFVQVAGPEEYEPSLERDGVPDVYAFGKYNAGERLDLGTVQLPSASVLNISVVGPDGKPLPGADVSIRHESGNASAYADLPLTADGRVGTNDALGVEVTGRVSVDVDRPSGATNLRNASRPLRVTDSRNITVQLYEEYEITGTLTNQTGPVENATVVATSPNVTSYDANITNSTGAFSLTGLANTSTNLWTYQLNRTISSKLVVPNRDGIVDIYAADVLNRSSEYDAGTISLPEPHTLNISVFNGTTSVSNATVNVTHHGANGSIASFYDLPVGTDGLVRPFDTEAPGLELNGSVTVEVTPPEGYAVEDAVKNVNVNESTRLTFDLNKTSTNDGSDESSGGSSGGSGSDDSNDSDGSEDNTSDGSSNETSEPQNASVVSATLSQTTITAGDNVTITATIENPTTENATLSVELSNETTTLAMNNSVAVLSNSTTTYSFTRPFNEPGTHNLSVNGEPAGTLEVRADDETDTGTPGFGIGATLAALLVAIAVARVRG